MFLYQRRHPRIPAQGKILLSHANKRFFIHSAIENVSQMGVFLLSSPFLSRGQPGPLQPPLMKGLDSFDELEFQIFPTQGAQAKISGKLRIRWLAPWPQDPTLVRGAGAEFSDLDTASIKFLANLRS